MSNDDHLLILRRGVKHWNAWRKENPQEIPQFGERRSDGVTEANPGRPLSKGDRTPLQKIDLREATLANATMEFVILDGADLARANLKQANLQRASLRGAILDGAFMQDVNLRGGDLTDAKLRGVDLRRAVRNRG